MAADLLYGLLPDHLVLASVLVLMLMEVFGAPVRAGRYVFVALLGAAAAALLHQLATGYAAAVVPGEVVVDRFAQLAKLVLVGSGFALGLAWPAHTAYKAWILAASSLLGGMVMMSSDGFATLFIGIELLSLPAFALMVHGNGRGAAADGAFRYLVLSSIATALLLFGIALSYGATGALSIDAFARTVGSGRPQETAALVLVLAGLFLKAAVFPFHAWAPDAYGSARLPVTAFLASVVKGAVVLALVRVLGGVTLGGNLALAVMTLALLSIVFGNLAALGQARFRTLLAYSSVAHAGYMVFALLDTTGSRPADLLWYVAFYAGATIIACAAIAVLLDDADDDRLDALDGRFAAHPVASLLLAAAVLSLAGLPPFPGFFAKLMVFQSVVASGHLVPAVLAFTGSFLGLAYYVGIVLRLFRGDTGARGAAA